MIIVNVFNLNSYYRSNVIIPLLRHIKVKSKNFIFNSLGRYSYCPDWYIFNCIGLSVMFISTDHVLKITILILIKTLAVSTFIGLLGAYTIILCFKRQWVPDFLGIGYFGYGDIDIYWIQYCSS